MATCELDRECSVVVIVYVDFMGEELARWEVDEECSTMVVVMVCVGSADEELATCELGEDRTVSAVECVDSACEEERSISTVVAACERDEECSVVVTVCVDSIGEELAI